MPAFSIEYTVASIQALCFSYLSFCLFSAQYYLIQA